LKALAQSNSFSSFKVDFISSQNKPMQFNPKQALITYQLIIKTSTKHHQKAAQGCTETTPVTQNTKTTNAVKSLGKGVHRSIWVGFCQTQNPSHIGYTGLGEVK
jgi:hypothetical protein